MDKIDLKILKVLQNNAKASVQQVSDEVGLSVAPVWRRIKKLEEKKVITGYHALVDRKQVGLQSCMFVQISLDHHSVNRVEKFIQAVLDAPEIVACYAVTGDADFLLKIVVTNPENYDDFLNRFFFDLPAVRQTRTSVVLKEIKNEVQLPIKL